MRTFRFMLVPVAKPRQTRRDQWAKRPVVLRFRAFADDLRDQATKQGFRFPEHGAVVTFYLPMPASWSTKRRVFMRNAPHQQKPDLDNLLKAVKDALLPQDDSKVWSLTAEKRWAEVASILVTVPE